MCVCVVCARECAGDCPCVCLEVRGRCLVSSSVSASPSPFSFKKGLSLKQKLATLTKLAGQRALGIWNL